MVLTRLDKSWMRRGCSLLWSTDLLSNVANPNQVVSMRQFFSLSKSWPEDLPSISGSALVVSGLEGCIDILESAEAERWIEHDMKDLVLSFQEEYEGQAALIFWVPSGQGRISMAGSTEEYFWKHGSKGSKGLHLGRLLYSGAENEVERIMNSEDEGVDYDGKTWSGLYHPRIS